MKTVAVVILIVLVIVATSRVLIKMFNSKVESLFDEWKM